MNQYSDQVDLLLQVLPIVAKHKQFALKGGTAINLFIRDMARLSVDIDLTYLPLEPRAISLENIDTGLKSIRDEIERTLTVQVMAPHFKEKLESTLVCANNKVQIKIEVNHVIRGAVYPCEKRILCNKAQEIFGRFVSLNTLSFADIYGGKVCAALDRQHPRDLFDIKILLENEGITDEVRKSFIIYLSSHNRPIVELLNPNLTDIKDSFETDFRGMSSVECNLEELLQARQELIQIIRQSLTIEEKAFLLSLKKGTPEWELLNIPNIDKLPAIQWKLNNIRNMDKQKHILAVQKLKALLEI